MSWQQTLKSSIHCSGTGLHSGREVRLTLHPAPVHHGLVFRKGRSLIPAHWSRVVDTRMCTVVADDDGNSIATIEHLMAALAGLGIDNAVIEVDGDEVPAMDGSADDFVFLIEKAGIERQSVRRRGVRVLKPVDVSAGLAQARLEPADAQIFTLDVDFPSQAIGRQSMEMTLSPARFRSDISRARTFGFKKDIEALQQNGLALGGSLKNAILVDGDKVANPEGLRFEDEFVRHKILDAIGDLALAGLPVIGRFRGYRSGHALNNQVLRALFADDKAYELVELGSDLVLEPPMSHRLRLAAG